MALNGCRCRLRKNFKYFNPQTSSSSDGVKGNLAVDAENNRRRKKKPSVHNAGQLVVNYVEGNPKAARTVTAAVEECAVCTCSDESIQNNNVMTVTKAVKDIIVEDNGNIILKDTGHNIEIPVNDNYVPDLAHV